MDYSNIHVYNHKRQQWLRQNFVMKLPSLSNVIMSSLRHQQAVHNFIHKPLLLPKQRFKVEYCKKTREIDSIKPLCKRQTYKNIHTNELIQLPYNDNNFKVRYVNNTPYIVLVSIVNIFENGYSTIKSNLDTGFSLKCDQRIPILGNTISASRFQQTLNFLRIPLLRTRILRGYFTKKN